MKSISLYQVASTGRMKVLNISVDGNLLITEWFTRKNGIDGLKQNTVEEILGMNEGKANETSPEEQADLEWVRKITKKKEEGYVESEQEALERVSVTLDITKQLPSEFAPSKPISSLPQQADMFDGSWYAEKKYNGVCLILHNTGMENIVYSRRMHPITNIVSCVGELAGLISKIPTQSIVIGELVASLNGQEDPSVLRGLTADKTDPQKAKEHYDTLLNDGWDIKFYPYDIYFLKGDDITEKKFKERNQILENILGIKRNITTISEYIISQARAQGWEGFILRQDECSSISYTLNGKAKRIGAYKYKFLNTTDCIVVGVAPGHGKHSGRFVRFKLAQYKNGELIGCGWAGPGRLGEQRCDELTQGILVKGYELKETELNSADWFAVELEYQSRQKENSAGELCFEFPIIIASREDKPLAECEIDI